MLRNHGSEILDQKILVLVLIYSDRKDLIIIQDYNFSFSLILILV